MVTLRGCTPTKDAYIIFKTDKMLCTLCKGTLEVTPMANSD